MSEAELHAIRQSATAAAEAAVRGENVPNPHPEGSEAARVWNQTFNLASAAEYGA